MVICGATGDLTERKLGPALYNLLLGGFLPPEFTVVGFARRDLSDDAVPRAPARRASTSYSRNRPVKPAIWESFAQGIEYHRGTLRRSGRLRGAREAAGPHRSRSGHGRQSALLPGRAARASTRRSCSQLERAGLAASGERSRQPDRKRGWTRVIVEKPFGFDLASAQALNAEIAAVFDEDQVYRIDHYLGKETVQNLSVFRFGNGLFEPIWNRRYIDSVQITVAETVGVEGRGEFYDADRGAARHRPEPRAPAAGHVRHGAAGRVRRRRTCATRSSRCCAPSSRCRPTRSPRTSSAASTSTAGSRASGCRSYRDEPEVAPDSETETFVALKLAIDSWRWAGVPFYIRTGKALPTPRDRDRGPVPSRAAGALLPRRRRPGRPERARHPRPARRGHPPPLRRQGARARACRSAP